jgi:hypothetical protein
MSGFAIPTYGSPSETRSIKKRVNAPAIPVVVIRYIPVVVIVVIKVAEIASCKGSEFPSWNVVVTLQKYFCPIAVRIGR